MTDSKLAEAMGAVSLGPLLNTPEAVASVVSRLLEDEAQSGGGRLIARVTRWVTPPLMWVAFENSWRARLF